MMLPGYDVCGECKGEGAVFAEFGWFGRGRGPCIPCSGVGSVPNDATVEAVATALNVHYMARPALTKDLARGALVAYAQHAKEN